MEALPIVSKIIFIALKKKYSNDLQKKSKIVSSPFENKNNKLLESLKIVLYF